MYNSRVEVNNGFEILSTETAGFFRGACGKIPQGGIRYPSDLMPNTVVFSSDNAHDLIDAMKNGYWDHTKSANQMKEWATLYI